MVWLPLNCNIRKFYGAKKQNERAKKHGKRNDDGTNFRRIYNANLGYPLSHALFVSLFAKTLNLYSKFCQNFLARRVIIAVSFGLTKRDERAII